MVSWRVILKIGPPLYTDKVGFGRSQDQASVEPVLGRLKLIVCFASARAFNFLARCGKNTQYFALNTVLSNSLDYKILARAHSISKIS